MAPRTWPNSDCVLIMDSNMAEAYPVAFRFVMQAKQKGATGGSISMVGA